jgi:transcriptional regulator with XRE-family HTH domain
VKSHKYEVFVLTESEVDWFLKVRELRLAAGLTQMELARKLDVDQSAVSLWESGKTKPCRKYRRKLARYLKCTEADLVGGDLVDKRAEG